MNRKLNSRIAFLGIVVLIAACTVFFFIHEMNSPGFKFYYPDQYYKNLKYEKRYINLNNRKREEKYSLLIKEYILGPLQNDLMNPLPEKVSLVDVWWVNDFKKEAIVINLTADFEKFAMSGNERVLWFIKGLKETINKNTGIKKIYLLSDNKKVKAKVGDFNLSYPIIVKK